MNPLDVKFKAKLKGQKELVEVVSLYFEKKELLVEIPYTLEWTTYLKEVKSFRDVEELLQYTGHQDKNGNEIYDGTNLKYDNNLYIVKRLKNGGFWAIDQRPNRKGFPLNSGETGFSVVVGNVYEED